MQSPFATVMFTELVGAASMFERHGDEDADRGRRELLGVLRRILAEHGGREVTSTHDTLMAAFSSAVSAVDCAIGMQREVTGRGAGATLQIGLDAGEPLAEGRELYGTPVIVAEQLCRAAEPGEILVSAGVRHIVGSRNAGQMPPAGALKLRGVAERTVASRVLWREEAANPAHPLHGAAMTSEMITVVIADDERLLRAGFRVILDSEPDMQVVGEAADGRAAVDLVRRRRPDVVLMDIRMPDLDGLEAAQQILEDPDLPTAVVMLTTFDRSEYLYKALRIGASGFLLKDATAERLLDAVRVTAAGDALLAPTVTRRLIEQFARSPQPAAGGVPPRLTALTARELEVLRHVARGLSNAEIAHALVLGENTIKSHVAHLLGKLGLRDRVQAVVLAYETGLVAPDAAARDAGP